MEMSCHAVTRTITQADNTLFSVLTIERVKRIPTGSPAASVVSEGSLADPSAPRRAQPAGQASDFVSRYWSNPTIPFCRPMPLFL